jgi:anti-anti-sigma regulatory factor
MTPPPLVCDRSRPRIRIVRFTRPDLRDILYDGEPLTESTLYRTLSAEALAGLSDGETIVMNFGLVEWFPSVFFGLLLDVNRAVHAAGARLILCSLPPSVREPFDVMGGGKLFEVRGTESRAVTDAGRTD